MPETTPEFIERVQAYCDAATVGPWEFEGVVIAPKAPSEPDNPTAAFLGGEFITQPAEHMDGMFIAQSRADLPRALKALREAKKLLEIIIYLDYSNGATDKCQEALSKMEAALNGEEVDDA